MDVGVDVQTILGFADGVVPLINEGRPFLARLHSELELTRKEVYQALRDGRLRIVCRGCLVDGRVSDSRRLRIDAINLVRPPGAIACNETAAFLYGIDAYKPSERHILTPSFVVPHGTSRLRRPHVRCRQAIISSSDLDLVDDIPTTNSVRTVSDLLRALYRPYALAAADAFARNELIEVGEVTDYVHRLKGYRWIVQARSLAALIDGRSESPGESWQRLRIHDAGFPPPIPQFEVVDSHGIIRRLDLAYPDLLIACEYDGRDFHTSDDDQLRDADRREDLTALHGWRWVIGSRERLFGADPAFELELGELLCIPPLLPRRWGEK